MSGRFQKTLTNVVYSMLTVIEKTKKEQLEDYGSSALMQVQENMVYHIPL